MNTEIWVALIGVVGGIGAAVVSGIFSSRMYLKKQMAQAQREAGERRRLSHDRAVRQRQLISAVCRVLFWIVFVLEKGVAQNGELERLREAMEKVEEAEAALKDVERSIVEEE